MISPQPIPSNPNSYHHTPAFTTIVPITHSLTTNSSRSLSPSRRSTYNVHNKPTARQIPPEVPSPPTNPRKPHIKPQQPSNIYFATCARGLGQYLATELTSPLIGAQVLSIHGSGVTFSSPHPAHLTAYRACLWLRTATRVLFQLHTQPVTNHGYALGSDVYQFVKRCADWEALLLGGRSFAVQARVSQRTGISERGVATCAKDAICDSLSTRRQPPPSYDHADLCVFVAVDDVITVYLDMGGASLHKRGYRDGIVHKAALNECVAAAMVYMAGFNPDGSFENALEEGKHIVLADPMCGSGTLLIEAGLLWLRVAVGLYRREFGCERWVDYDESMMAHVRREAVQCQRTENEEYGLTLLGGDIHKGSLRLAQQGVSTTRLNTLTELWHGDVFDMQAGDVDVTLCNPPWGVRLNADGAWEGLGQFLRRGGQGVACVMSGAKGAGSRALRMRSKKRIPVRIGGVDARVLLYDVLPRR